MPIVRLVNPRHSHGGRAGSWRFSAVERGSEHMAHRYKIHHHRRHRNPLDSGTVVTAAWALGGGVLATWIPATVLPSMSAGWTGVLATGAAAVAIGWAGGKFLGARAGDGLMIGGLVAFGGKAIAQLMGKNLVSFMGQYTTTWFGPPYNSTGVLQTTPNPMAALAPAAGSGGGSTAAAMSGLLGRTSRFRSRFAR